jgi:hypothetical protein
MVKNEPLDMKLDNEIKDRVWKMYDKPSAYRSGMLVKLYREAGGKYSGDKDKDEGLSRWYREVWESDKGTKNYPHKNSVYRPTIRITKDTPTTFAELTPAEIERAKNEKARTGRVKKFKK